MSANHLSPLRYPGGKSFLTSFLAEAIRLNNASSGRYVEPCAGGAGAALGLLFGEHVSFIHINDLDPRIFSFWHSILFKTDAFLKLLCDSPVNVSTWQEQREIIRQPNRHSRLHLGFATFYLNRCNRSGALNAGPIGGMDQTGSYSIDVRFNKYELRRRIERIALFRDRITVSGLDAVTLLCEQEATEAWDIQKTIVYLDPPYHEKGRCLYKQFFRTEDHSRLANFLNGQTRLKWIVSYDDVTPIRKLYSGEKNVLYMNYFMHTVRIGRELIIASADCQLPMDLFTSQTTSPAERMTG